MSEMVAWKIIYYAYMFAVPYFLVGGISFGFWLCVSVHFICRWFYFSNYLPNCSYYAECEHPTTNKEGTIENNWAIHQLQTTSNYAPKSRFFSWFVGGLNFQVEHHLFPNICHVHYKNISHIVKAKAEKYGLPYYTQKSYLKAIIEHTKMLKSLGRA